MALIIHPNHLLYYRCRTPMALYFPYMKTIVPPANMTRMKENSPISFYGGMSVVTMLQKIGRLMWKVMRKFLGYCVKVMEPLNSSTFYTCTREDVAMMDASKKCMVGLEALEMPWLEVRKLEIQPASLSSATDLDQQMKIKEDSMMEADGDEVALEDWLELESDESDDCSSDDDDDDKMEEQAFVDKDETEWTDEDSDWSNEDEDSEASTESTELWESFLKNDNPLYFSCTIGSKAKSAVNTHQQNQTTSSREVKRSTSTDVEEQSPKDSTQEGTKKVRFSEEVTVHNLEGWGFASRNARDGSCWLQLARDRERFRRRVEKTGEVLTPCLSAQHRSRVWDKFQRQAQTEHS